MHLVIKRIEFGLSNWRFHFEIACLKIQSCAGEKMSNHPKTKAEAAAYWKGSYFGRGSYDENHCVYSVHEGGRSVGFRQCQQKPGFGPEGLYCKRHAKEFGDKK